LAAHDHCRARNEIDVEVITVTSAVTAQEHPRALASRKKKVKP